jgi:biopolymer transport protein ExbD
VELNITAFMNLMVILVPFLLITAVFSRLAVLELDLPVAAAPGEAPPTENLYFEVIVRENGLEIGERGAGLLAALPMTEAGHDYEGLTAFLLDIKAEHPDKTDATVLLEPDVPYDVLVQVMDAVREYAPAEEAGIARAELFPDISVGDAPQRAREG